MPRVCDAVIVDMQTTAAGHRRMVVRAPELVADARPGQFCMLQVSDGLYPFLRRPMSIERLLPDGMSFLFKIEGQGTRMLADMRAGQALSVQGPLGTGWPLDFDAATRHILVGGGIGVAPFGALVDAFVVAGRPAPEVVLAARTREWLLCVEAFEEQGCAVCIATDDGSAGVKAYANHALESLKPGPGTRVYACGPMPMMCATAVSARAAGAECFVSLEAQMACGDGACLGCVVESTRELEGEKMVRVCKDGPVFNAALIDWAAHSFVDDR